ncbi:glycerol kinase GlpK [candidate division FCPU426 bacterium]|nr:glycerol kinase GlpK [candidate division FCPU426 bacterium]
MKAILAIDQGTTGSRAILFNPRGQKIAGAYREFSQYFPRPGWVEHNAEEIWLSVRATIQKVLAAAPHVSIAAIGIANQRETTVLWDRETGRPLHHAIVWQCRRTADRCLALSRRKGTAALVRRKTGLPLDAYFSGTKLEWLLQHLPSAPSLARQGRLCFGTTDSWVLWQLTGGKVHATDYTNASRTMLFDIEKRRWDPSLLGMFSLPASLLPEVKPSSGIFGYTVRLGRLPAGIPIAGIAGDQQAALFGQTCFTPGTIKNTYGTGCFLLLNTGSTRIHSQRGLITTLGCDHAGRPVYVLEGAVFIAGAAVQWLRDGLQILPRASRSEKMALALPANDGVYFVPAFVGLGAPYWDQNARGLISGLTRGTRREHLVRAALEAMAYSTRDVLDTMKKESGLALSSLRVDGGAAANAFLCQFQADILGLPVIRPRLLELTALGAAYLAGLAAGVWPSSRIIQKQWQLDRRFVPRRPKAQADQFYQGWLQAVARARL